MVLLDGRLALGIKASATPSRLCTMFPTFASLLSTLALLPCALTSPTGSTPAKTINKRAVTPVLSAASQVATASDPYWNRDSCTSVRVQYREFWTCRDSAGQGGQFYSSTASWSDFNNGPLITNGQLYLYGDDNGEYFKNQPDECQAGSNSGNCMNGTRYAIWPDSPPLPVSGANNAVKLYTWIIKSYLNNDLSPITKNRLRVCIEVITTQRIRGSTRRFHQ